MNIYTVVDGELATKKIYQKWISFANRNLRYIDYPTQFDQDNYYIFASKRGYPGIWNVAERAIEDVNSIREVNRLVVCVDSEDATYEDMLSEAKQRVEKYECRVDVEIKYVIQHFCLETWLLGNNNLFPRNPRDSQLQEYYARFNIREGDPEYLPDYKQKSMNRAGFAYNYLRAGIMYAHNNDKHYSKRSAGIAQEETFFNRVRSRCLKKQHIQSFRGFLDAFA